MEKKLNLFLKNITIKHYPYIAFGLSIVIASMAFAFTSIAPGGYRMLYVSDFYGEYLNFLINLKHIIQGKESFLYSWNIDMGMGIIGLNAYYMSSPLNLLIIWLNEKYIIYGASCLVILRIGLASMCSYICLLYIYNRRNSLDSNADNDKRIKQNDKYKIFLIVLISVCYSMCGWILTNFFNILWQDALFMLPLIMYFTIKMVENGKTTGLVLSYAYMFLSNYYMGYMIVVMMVFALIGIIVYKRIVLECKLKKKEIINIILKYILAITNAAMICGFLLMPSFLQILDKLKDNNENFQVNCLNFGVLSFLHGLLPGSYTSLENGNPAIYTGLFVVIFVLAYFACKNVNKKEKILVGAFLLIMFLIMNIQVANIFMHAFDEPDWFEFRYSYVFSFLMAIVAVLAINNNCIQDFKGKNIIFICLNLFVVIYSGFTHIIINIFNETSLQKYGIFKCSIYEIIINLVVINLIWLIVYLFQNKKIIIRDMYLVILMVIILEQCVNFYIIVEGIEKESGFFKYDYVQEEVDFLNEQVNEIKEDDNDFYRIESNYIVSHNDAYALGYRGITNYTSVCNYKLNETLSDLGIRVNGWRVDYEGATPFLESIFNIKYMFHFAPRSWLEDKEIDEEFFIQENDFYLPVGFGVSDEIKKYKYSIDNTTAIERQNYIINCMLDNEESYYTVPEYECTLNNLSKKDNSDGSVTYEKINKTEKASISYKIPYTNKNNQYYYSYYYDIAKEYYEGHISTNSTVDSKNKTIADQELKVPRTIFINENISDDTDMLSVNIVIDEEKVTFLSEGIYELDMNKYKTVYNQLNQNVMQVLEYTNTSLKGTIETKENQLVFTSIPYDKGWTVQVDGKTQKTTPLMNESFLGIEVPEGKHQIELNYTPEGLKLGTIISIVGIITLIIYVTVPIKYYYMVNF